MKIRLLLTKLENNCLLLKNCSNTWLILGAVSCGGCTTCAVKSSIDLKTLSKYLIFILQKEKKDIQTERSLFKSIFNLSASNKSATDEGVLTGITMKWSLKVRLSVIIKSISTMSNT